jgi:disulfide bond formation protein DsbB
MIQIISQFISFGTVMLIVATVGFFVLIVLKRMDLLPSQLEWLLDIVGNYALWIVLLVSGGAMAGSLFYSDIAGFPPCPICWYQRILLYPQVLIAAIALWTRDRRAATRYLLGLSYIGGAIALYHTYLQYGGSPLVPCSAAAEAVSCAQRFVFEFGFVTIPMMSLAVYAAIILVLFADKKQD